MSDEVRTLLIVDDEPFNLDILQEHLEDEGYAVVRAEDGQQALDIIYSREHDFTAILLDRMMPNMDGIEVLKELNSQKEFNKIPVIIQTAAASDSDIKEGIDAGAFYYLTKPFEPELMLSVVQSAVIDRQNMREAESNVSLISDLKENIVDITLAFKTISDAQKVAGSIASLFPDPDRVMLGLSELSINAIEHGNLGISYDDKSELLTNNSWYAEIESRLAQPEYKDKVATIRFQRLEDEMQVTLIDQGKGFDWSGFMEFSSDRVYSSHGRGIAMAGMVSFDKLEYRGIGNEVVCTIKLNGENDQSSTD